MVVYVVLCPNRGTRKPHQTKLLRRIKGKPITLSESRNIMTGCSLETAAW